MVIYCIICFTGNVGTFFANFNTTLSKLLHVHCRIYLSFSHRFQVLRVTGPSVVTAHIMLYRQYEFRELIVILTELFELIFQNLSRVSIQKKDGNLATLDTSG